MTRCPYPPPTTYCRFVQQNLVESRQQNAGTAELPCRARWCERHRQRLLGHTSLCLSRSGKRSLPGTEPLSCPVAAANAVEISSRINNESLIRKCILAPHGNCASCLSGVVVRHACMAAQSDQHGSDVEPVVPRMFTELVTGFRAA